jgi:hypothetical protein
VCASADHPLCMFAHGQPLGLKQFFGLMYSKISVSSSFLRISRSRFENLVILLVESLAKHDTNMRRAVRNLKSK